MLVSISHTTRYVYDDNSRYTVQSYRLTPPSFRGQRVLSWKISAPGIETATRFFDAFHNIGHLICIRGDHTAIEIRAEGLVETEDRAGIVRGLTEVVPTRVFLRETDKTVADASLRALGAKVRSSGTIIDGLHTLMHTVRDEVDYEVGVTGAHTSAIDAYNDKRGVCQDHAHIFIAAARSAGVPARYVNGYFLCDSDAPSEAHHAWAEAYVDGLGWVGFDPANRMCPTDRYVRLACGLDAVSAAPIRGNRRGGAKEALDVLVEVQQANSQQ